MMYTSGTTGQPKGVRRPLPEGDPDDVAGTAAAVFCQGFGIRVDHGTHLVCGPMYHAGPFTGVTNALHAGHTVVVMRQWTPEHFLELVERHHVTDTQMVPTMFVRLLALPEQERARVDVSSVESIFHTGAPCPVDVKQRMMDWFGPVVVRDLRRHRGRRHHRHPAPVVGEARHCRPTHRRRGREGPRRRRQRGPGRRARFDLHRLGASRARRILQGPGEVGVDPARFVGRPSATSATSTTTGTCSCATARSTW